MNASHFRSGSRRLQKKLWWQNFRVSYITCQNISIFYEKKKKRLKLVNEIYGIISLPRQFFLPLVILNKKKSKQSYTGH